MGSAKRSQRIQKQQHQQLRPRNTRSSKGRLLSDPATNNRLLAEQLRALGLYAAPTLGDGNCLFRALSDQLHGSPSKHLQLREDICDWIASHKTRYEPFVEDERGLDIHLKCMRENGTYGGHMELSAFAHLSRRNVKVIQPGLVYVIDWTAFEDPDDTASRPATYTTHTSSSIAPPSTPGKKHRPGRSKGPYREEPDVDHGGGEADAEEDDAQYDTVYVAYHDWEHFSSIRNLKGPHTGFPRVQETPAPSTPLPTEKPKAKGRLPKIKLKLSSSSTLAATPKDTDSQQAAVASAPPAAVQAVSTAATALNASSSVDVRLSPRKPPSTSSMTSIDLVDAALIPLPSSRSISPSPELSQPSTTMSITPPDPSYSSSALSSITLSSALLSTAIASSSTSVALASSSKNTIASQLAHISATITTRTTRSPKRTIEESSNGSGSEGREPIEESVAKRTRSSAKASPMSSISPPSSTSGSTRPASRMSTRIRRVKKEDDMDIDEGSQATHRDQDGDVEMRSQASTSSARVTRSASRKSVAATSSVSDVTASQSLPDTSSQQSTSAKTRAQSRTSTVVGLSVAQDNDDDALSTISTSSSSLLSDVYESASQSPRSWSTEPTTVESASIASKPSAAPLSRTTANSRSAATITNSSTPPISTPALTGSPATSSIPPISAPSLASLATSQQQSQKRLVAPALQRQGFQSVDLQTRQVSMPPAGYQSQNLVDGDGRHDTPVVLAPHINGGGALASTLEMEVEMEKQRVLQQVQAQQALTSLVQTKPIVPTLVTTTSSSSSVVSSIAMLDPEMIKEREREKEKERSRRMKQQVQMYYGQSGYGVTGGEKDKEEEKEKDKDKEIENQKGDGERVRTRSQVAKAKAKEKEKEKPTYIIGKGGVVMGIDGRPLTRRQRKALGLPKPKKLMVESRRAARGKGRSSAVRASAAKRTSSGRSRGEGDDEDEDEEGAEDDEEEEEDQDEGNEEWRRNGVGRVDVRGFRELKI